MSSTERHFSPFRFLKAFPFGAAPAAILCMAVLAGIVVWWQHRSRVHEMPDLVVAVFAPNHMDAYRRAIPAFEAEHNVRVQVQLVDQNALRRRLHAALQVGAPTPDLVELPPGSMDTFSRGPLDQIGFLDLTERLRDEGLRDRFLESRFSLWSTRGRVFALPADVHPVMLCYRRDLVEALGIDVNAMETWDDFVAVGREVTADLTGNGVIDRYMLDLPHDGAGFLTLLLLQKGGQLVDAQGHIAFDTPETAALIAWYLRQTRGPDRISFPAGWGQTLAQALNEGLVLFYFAPDWRTKQFEMDMPRMEGNLALMPLPAWTPGGRRTSVWGGTGLAIPVTSRNPDLAWALAKYLYTNPAEQVRRFEESNILPPLPELWEHPVLNRGNVFYSDQSIGRLYAELAVETPPDFAHPYRRMAETKLSDALLAGAAYQRRHGEAGLEAFLLETLRQGGEEVRRVMKRNVFLEAP